MEGETQIIEGVFLNIPTQASRDIVSVIEWYPHIYYNKDQCVSSAHELQSVTKGNQVIVFTFVQNPFERVVQAWQKHASQQTSYASFAKFVDDLIAGKLSARAAKDTCLQHPYVDNYFDAGVKCHIFRCEDLELDFEVMKMSLDIPDNVKFLHGPSTAGSGSNASSVSYQSYQSYYDAITKAKVEEYYQKDLSRFGYSFWNV